MKKGKTKFEVGTIHEIGTGKFEVLERFKKENQMWLKYRFLESNKKVENKEANVNACIWKFKQLRGLTEKQISVKEEKDDLNEKVDDVLHKLDSISSWDECKELILVNQNNETEINKKLSSLTDTIRSMYEIIQVQQTQIDSLLKDRTVINKLIEKI